jgi:TDG/mug DNA glycosylase family protein
VEWLFRHRGIGFTDLVKRPTRGAADLRAVDYQAGATRLLALIEDCRPRFAWFHGKLAYKQFLRRTGRVVDAEAWGLQPLTIGETRVFVTPNPSPANAAFSLGELVAWYDALADLPAVHR